MPSAVLAPVLATLLAATPAAQGVVTTPVENMYSAADAGTELYRGARRPR